jgi:RNA recognition motif-containing protein
MDFAEYQIYVGNLHRDVTDSLLFDFFQSSFSGVSEARIARHADGSSRGFGFVRYDEADRAYKAVTSFQSRVSLPRSILKMVPLVRETYMPSLAEISRGVDFKDGKTIFVGNLSSDLNDEALREAFSKFGRVLSVRSVSDRGFGLVTFAEHISALAALSEMQDTELLHHRMYCCWARKDQQDEEQAKAGSTRTSPLDDFDDGGYMIPASDPLTEDFPSKRSMDKRSYLAFAIAQISASQDGFQSNHSLTASNHEFIMLHFPRVFSRRSKTVTLLSS